MQVRAPVLEIKTMNFYLYPSLLAGQGIEARKPLRDLLEFSTFVEIYSSLHTAVAKAKKSTPICRQIRRRLIPILMTLISESLDLEPESEREKVFQN
jgi:hypothetical protein